MRGREMTLKDGTLVAFGQLMKPPFRLVQEGNRVLVNDVEVYPLPSALPSTTDGEYPNLEELLRRVQSEDEVLGDTPYKEQADRVRQCCSEAGFQPRVSAYGDVVVEIEPGVFRILLIDEQALAAARDAQEPTLGAEDVSGDTFFDGITEQLQAGSMIVLGRSYLSVVPKQHLGRTQEAFENVARSVDLSASPQSKGEPALRLELAFTSAVFHAKLAEAYPPESLALVTFHSDIWDVFLRMPTPIDPTLMTLRQLPSLGLVTTMLDDCAITISAWDSWLRKGAKLYYNMSHGDIVDGNVVIRVGNDPRGKPTNSFGAPHVRTLGAKLHGSLVHNYSCHSLENTTLADAFLEAGASAYVGWTAPTSARPEVIDRVESEFWRLLVTGSKSVGETIASMHQGGVVPISVNAGEADLRYRGDGEARLTTQVS